MPDFSNPLDHFRSHSYHFILTVANTTEAFRKLTEEDGFMSAVSGVQVGNKLNLEGEEAYLLLDTRRFSNFAITKLDMQHMYGTGTIANPTVPASFMKMTITDATGLTFFNFLMDTMKNKLQSTRASAFFMLAIIFVGHNDDYPEARTETISTCYIPMILLQMGFDFSSFGSTYELEFMETEGNPGQGMPQMIDLGDVQAISTEGKPNTIGGMIQALEDRLNQDSIRWYQKYSNEAFVQATGDQRNAKQAGKLVQTMITIPKEWTNFKIDTAGKSRNFEQVFIAKKKDKLIADKKALDAAATTAQVSGDQTKIAAVEKARASYKSFNYTMNVPDAIKVILESSKEYLDLASKDKMKSGQAVVHKTVVNITSDQTTYITHYDVYSYKAPPPPVRSLSDNVDRLNAGQKSPSTLQNGAARNLIEYDYIFSGKNSHILDLKIQFSPAAAAPALDMNLNLGQKRLADNSSAGQKTANVDAVSQGLNKSVSFNPLMRPGEPLFPKTKTSDEQNHFTSHMTEEMKSDDAVRFIKAKQEHTGTLAILHFIGSLEAEMVIRGNPNLMRKYADRGVRGGVARHTITMDASTLRSLTTNNLNSFIADTRTKVTGGKDEYFQSYVLPRQQDNNHQGQTDPVLGGPDVAVGPLFAKINILSPNTDYMGNIIPGEPPYRNDFFFQGSYMVLFISHVFENGSFKQSLKLLPYDLDGSFTQSTTASPPETTPKKTI